MSNVIGMELHTALTAAGHSEFHTVRTGYDVYRDEVVIRFDRGPADKYEFVTFRIPETVFDPTQYAKAKWPHWFVDKSIPNEEQKK